jgi:hypothetical protein
VSLRYSPFGHGRVAVLAAKLSAFPPALGFRSPAAELLINIVIVKPISWEVPRSGNVA